MSFFSRRRLLVSALGLVCALSLPSARAQPAAGLPKKEISDSASAGFAKLQPLIEAKNYPAALALVQQQLASSPAQSYEAYVLSQIQAQILLTQNKLVEAIAPLERAHALAEGNANFLEAPAHLERLHILAQLHYQAGAEQKTPAAQRAGYEKALAYVARWFARSTKPSAEVRYFAASLLYNLATLDAARPDAARLREAAGHAREALLLSPKPNNQARLLLVACEQQLGDNARAAELLEVLAVADPKTAGTWSQLQSLYLALAENSKDPAQAGQWSLRAFITLERAQAHGHLVSPKDNYTKVAILFNLQQFTRAAELMEKGFADGTLENSRRNWELLASAYQQTDREERAIDAMDRAVKKFPEDGALEFSLAQFLYNAGKVSDAYSRGRSALAKPGLEKPGQTRLYLAFLAYELQRYEEAKQWLESARASGEVPAATLDPLNAAITEALRNREAAART